MLRTRASQGAIKLKLIVLSILITIKNVICTSQKLSNH